MSFVINMVDGGRRARSGDVPADPGGLKPAAKASEAKLAAGARGNTNPQQGREIANRRENTTRPGEDRFLRSMLENEVENTKKVD